MTPQIYRAFVVLVTVTVVAGCSSRPTARPVDIDRLEAEQWEDRRITLTGQVDTLDWVLGEATGSFTFLLVGDTTGTTTLPIPLGMIEIGLATPFAPLPLGLADSSGDVSLDVMLPPALPSQVGLFAQSISLDLSIGMGRPTLTACTSDVEGFNVGTAPM